MKNILKKNQIMITALAIMIAIAGYLNFAGTNLEKEDYLSVDSLSPEAAGLDSSGELRADSLLDLSEEDLAAVDSMGVESLDMEGMNTDSLDIESLDSDAQILTEDYLNAGMETALLEETPEEGEIPGEAVFTNTNSVATLSEAKLLKEQTRARNKEALLDIINSTELSDAQKQIAVDSMIQMTGIAQMETAAEILLEAKGFQDVVVSISNDCVDVVVNASDLSDAQRAQIEDIVKRKTNVSAENIIISTVVQ